MEAQAAIREIAYIYHIRNMLGRERDRLRHKLNYLRDIKNSKQAKDNFESSALWRRIKQQHKMPDPELITAERARYLKDNPIPRRFSDIKLSELNIMLLEAERKVVDIKIKVMKHTRKYDKRLKELSEVATHTPRYVCGLVQMLSFLDDEVGFVRVNMDDMKRYHDEFLAEKAIDKMLKE